MLWAKITHIVQNLARVSNHFKLLADLEILICSGLESKHRTIVNSSIQLWNSTFGASQEKLIFSPKLKDALLRLRPIAELQLSWFPESLESEVSVDQGQLPNFADTQDSGNFFGSTSIDSVMKNQSTTQLNMSPASRIRNFTPQVVIEVAQSVPLKRSRESTPDPSNRKLRKRNLAPKLRHDDSQIQFEAIESSPISDAVLDSQLLTERQKEVRERQQAEAAMFPDIRSSPRSKEKSNEKWPRSNGELPLHRSASKECTASPDVERETTPTFILQGEYDDYVNSSPTPTRALREDNDVPDPPSSPPESIVQEQPTTYNGDETDIPSSPPEIPRDMENNTTTSLNSSALVDPYTVENNRILSTFESISNDWNSSAILDSAQIEATKPEVIAEGSTAEAKLNLPSPVLAPVEAETSIVDEPAVEAPSTPIHLQEGPSTAQQTPRSPVFHDALTSPASSDKVFEDALSSPRLNLDKAKTHKTPSPLSDLDESSVLRLMEGYDQDSARPRRSVRFAVKNKESQNNTVSRTSSKVLSQPSVLTDAQLDISTSGSGSSIEHETDVDGNKESPSLSEEAYLSSPLASLIPETPGAKSTMNLQIVDGEEVDLDETIIVDDSILEENEVTVANRITFRKRKSDANADLAASPAFKRVKHEVTADPDEIPIARVPCLRVSTPGIY